MTSSLHIVKINLGTELRHHNQYILQMKWSVPGVQISKDQLKTLRYQKIVFIQRIDLPTTSPIHYSLVLS